MSVALTWEIEIWIICHITVELCKERTVLKQWIFHDIFLIAKQKLAKKFHILCRIRMKYLRAQRALFWEKKKKSEKDWFCSYCGPCTKLHPQHWMKQWILGWKREGIIINLSLICVLMSVCTHRAELYRCSCFLVNTKNCNSKKKISYLVFVLSSEYGYKRLLGNSWCSKLIRWLHRFLCPYS